MTFGIRVGIISLLALLGGATAAHAGHRSNSACGGADDVYNMPISATETWRYSCLDHGRLDLIILGDKDKLHVIKGPKLPDYKPGRGVDRTIWLFKEDGDAMLCEPLGPFDEKIVHKRYKIVCFEE